MVDGVWIDPHCLNLVASIEVIFLIHRIVEEELGQSLGGVNLDIDGFRCRRSHQDAVLPLLKEQRAALVEFVASPHPGRNHYCSPFSNLDCLHFRISDIQNIRTTKRGVARSTRYTI